MDHEERNADECQYLDPRLRNTGGILLPETGAQFQDVPPFDASYQHQSVIADDVFMDLGADISWAPSDDFAGHGDYVNPQDDTESSTLYDPAVVGTHHPYPNMGSQSHYHGGTSWPPTTPVPSYLKQHTFPTPPDSCSPHSMPLGDASLPHIAFPPLQQQRQHQHEQILSLDTTQPCMMMGRDTLSPYDTYRTPVSCKSTQQDHFDGPNTPTRRRATQRGRSKSAAGYGMTELMTEQFLDQSDQQLDIQRWAYQNLNNTNQLREVQTTPHPGLVRRSPQLPRSAPPSVAVHKCGHEGCDKEFATKQDLHHHERYHKEGTHICEECQKGFQFPKDLARHLESKIHNPTGGGEHACGVPGCRFFDKGWARRDHWKRHMERVHGYIIPTRSRHGSEAGR